MLRRYSWAGSLSWAVDTGALSIPRKREIETSEGAMPFITVLADQRHSTPLQAACCWKAPFPD